MPANPHPVYFSYDMQKWFSLKPRMPGAQDHVEDLSGGIAALFIDDLPRED